MAGCISEGVYPWRNCRHVLWASGLVSYFGGAYLWGEVVVRVSKKGAITDFYCI